jgi:hypothetical protein
MGLAILRWYVVADVPQIDHALCERLAFDL